MGVSELRQLGAQGLGAASVPASLQRDLVQAGLLSVADASLVQLIDRQCDAPVSRILVDEGLISEAQLLSVQARRHAARVVTDAELADLHTDPDGPAPELSLRASAVTVVSPDGTRAFLTSDPDRPGTPDDLPLLLAPPAAVQSLIARDHQDLLVTAASTRVPAALSARHWGLRPRQRMIVCILIMLLMGGLAYTFPTAVLLGLVGWAVLTLFVSSALKVATYMAQARRAPPASPAPSTEPLPTVSLLVPLFHETEIVHALVTRLQRLTYPKPALDVLFLTESEDRHTRDILAAIDLPGWMRVITVPRGAPQTKPRAMNYALDFCRGDIIGIFDAEDAPEPDQVHKVARRFQSAPPDLGCLQGVLDYYNPQQTWLARCFSIEYATWFRLILPGMAALNLALPLGGTSVYFRREVLEQLGGWDAHNVTEDADLGIRLARYGYRTEMIDSVTGEEASHRVFPWIKQRSRWLKGYMVTYLVHMQRPGVLMRQLGARRFWGVQAHFLSAISQALLAPVLWSFWLILLGLGHPLDGLVPQPVLIGLGGSFLVVEVLGLLIHLSAVSGPEHRHLIPWAPTMHFYAPLATIAAYKALIELVASPFYWDKTNHGHSLTHIRGDLVRDRSPPVSPA